MPAGIEMVMPGDTRELSPVFVRVREFLPANSYKPPSMTDSTCTSRVLRSYT